MNQIEVEEAISVLTSVLVALLAIASGAGRPASNLRRVCGDLLANAESEIRGLSVGTALRTCFETARLTGVSLESMGRVRLRVSSLPAEGVPAAAIRTAATRFCLVNESYVVASLRFRSREEVNRLAARMNAVFAPAEEQAADAMDVDAFRALVTLRAAVNRDLAARGRPLPRIVEYRMAERMPALALAQRLYGDPRRTDELIAENNMVHPLFAPAVGRALSR